jgi:ATP-dependent DNA ligase
MRCAIMPLLEDLRADECPFVDLPEKRRTPYSLAREEMQNCHWVKPLLVAQINFQEWTPDRRLRHSSFVGLREDKDPRTVVRE